MMLVLTLVLATSRVAVIVVAVGSVCAVIQTIATAVMAWGVVVAAGRRVLSIVV